MVRCNGVTKQYAGNPVIQNVDLTLGAGICGLMGANGAGKSTLLKMLSGLLHPDTGSITLAGLNPALEPVRCKHILGVLPEELGVFDLLTVRENIQLMGPIYGLSAAQSEERTDQLLNLLDLFAARHRFTANCSYGMRKKTALAMALLHSPKVLLLDEPFEGVDPSSSRTIQNTLTRAATAGVTVLFTSHSLALVEAFSSRVLILHHGEIAWDSAQQTQGASLEQTYFDIVGTPDHEELPWLGC